MSDYRLNTRARRLQVVLGAMTLVTGFVLMFAKVPFFGGSELDFIFPLVFMLSGVMIFLMNYLRTGSLFNENEKQEMMSEEIRHLRNELAHGRSSSNEIEFLHHQIERLKEIVGEVDHKEDILTSNQRAEIVDDIKSSIIGDASNSVLLAIEKKFSKDIKRDRFVDSIREQCEMTRRRLMREIDSLTRRGNLNLIIGVLTTVVAVVILASTVLSGEKQLTNDELISYYLPRITLSLFVEIFSFFFLKLYKAGLNEIKYFQNELTNAEMKFIAAEKAIMLESIESQSKVIESLSETERNFKLTKGESTVELEKYRAHQDSMTKVLDSVKGIVSGAKKT
ncbi:membrane hypothetical protein [Vibrio nigripulchritudo MADA3029]|uniref:hypothetical protein n=1 Tax=Vibrio nigripulchritudo TaxID=28173 RepID=UPI00021C1F1E|nr:hypothetical protein [Vibrio nigripulchritudo]EGU60461.1 hypothetical protein VINI7043_25322 [Vibrio nigripulchritudo ATCC 27043]CCN49263.1 membrane hypothetical protein [Vibrio nigripulchritudo MADA3020]CCN54247.1 membrane hypothetical protein [Vibrio nigripulchritudo MADA3021]CCN61318.1 membrane hypothetical protein [Vibrio nigripulchritudo MADA3029]